MERINEYIIKEELSRNDRTLVYRAVDAEDHSFILKVLRHEYADAQKMERFRSEYELVNSMQSENVIQSIELIKHNNSLAIVFEDFGSETLQDYIHQIAPVTIKEELIEVLRLAVQVCRALAAVHDQNIVHKDLNPNNIVFSEDREKLKLIDFGLAAEIFDGDQDSIHLRHLEGTYAYISPEQTGRVNRPVDHRSDFYSLGIILYELLCGQIPFKANNPREWIHCHVARQPVELYIKNLLVPKSLSDVVMKLLSKSPDDRYQSSYGIIKDLEACVIHLEANLSFDDYPVGRQDIVKRFTVPEKLYARDAEINQLKGCFERSCKGEICIAIVKGYSGIGKTSLVNQLQQPVQKRNGYFLTGKFEQFDKNIPYVAFIQAFSKLINQILTEPEEEIRRWRKSILNALKGNAHLLVEVIPQLELIIGKQPAPQELPLKAHNRFVLSFISFVQVFASEKHPLVLFLDDLQWVDSASLEIIELLIGNNSNHPFMLVLSYRDNEITLGHPLLPVLHHLEKIRTHRVEIKVEALNVQDVRDLVADSFACSRSDVNKLAAISIQKTNGNPFFLIEFLSNLYPLKMVSFDTSLGQWVFNYDEIKRTEVTDNVVDLISQRLEALDEETQEILKLASCLGPRFDRNTLSNMTDKPLSTIDKIFKVAIEERFIYSLDGYSTIQFDDIDTIVNYGFLHDKIKHAVYSQIDGDTKSIIHLHIGRLLLNRHDEKVIGDDLFNILGHFNKAINEIEANERLSIAKLNMQACKRVLKSGAYKIAYDYANRGLALLTDEDWESDFYLAYELHLNAAESAAYCGEYTNMDHLLQVLQLYSTNLLDKARISTIRIKALISQNQQQKAIQESLVLLKRLGIGLPSKPGLHHVLYFVMKTRWLLKSHQNNLEDLPIMTDQVLLMAMKVMGSMISILYRANPNLLMLIVFKLVRLTLKHGVAPISPVGIVTYSLLSNAMFSNTDQDYQLSQAGMRLFDRMENKEHWPQAFYLFNVGVRPWKEAMDDVINDFFQCYHKAQEVGDFETMQSTVVAWASYGFRAGYQLKDIQNKIHQFSQTLSQYHQEIVFSQLNLIQQMVFNFQHGSISPEKLIGEIYNEEEMISYHYQEKDDTSLFMIYLNKITIGFHFEKYDEVKEMLEESKQYIKSSSGLVVLPVYYCYESLNYLANYKDQNSFFRRKSRRVVTANQKRMKTWMNYAHMNFSVYYHLVEAELSRVKGQTLSAINHYTKASENAFGQNNIQMEALARELFGKFWIDVKNFELAQLNLSKAYKLYDIWGSKGKADFLMNHYGEYILYPDAIAKATQVSTSRTSHSATSTVADDIDLATILDAAKTISGEIVLSRLIKKTLKIILEQAGAQRGLFWLKDDVNEQLSLEAIGTVNKNRITVSLGKQEVWEQIVPVPVINLVERTKQMVILADAANDVNYRKDPYIKENNLKSIIVLPILAQSKITGILYLENNLAARVFNRERVSVLTILCTQLAVSLGNARLFNTLEQKVSDRTKEISIKNLVLQEQKEELEAVRDQLKELNATKDRFFSIIAHDLRGPLGTSNSILELLTEDLNDFSEEEIRHFLNTLRTSTEYTYKLLDNLLLWAKSQRKEINFDPQRNSLTAIIESGIELMQHSLNEKKISINVNVLTETEAVFDRDMIATVFRNVLSNAIKYVNGEGKIDIIVERKNKTVTVSVNDNGIGIGVERLKNLFKIGEKQGSKEGTYGEKGSGLGLILCREFIERHQGQIWAESQSGEGSKFVFTIPCHKEE
ncbi:MAG: AAA family ATPase [Marinilabiliaceae bacterium]|nr:AAA family ATPase [Marinilabiliaceae bacterium]